MCVYVHLQEGGKDEIRKNNAGYYCLNVNGKHVGRLRLISSEFRWEHRR